MNRASVVIVMPDQVTSVAGRSSIAVANSGGFLPLVSRATIATKKQREDHSSGLWALMIYRITTFRVVVSGAGRLPPWTVTNSAVPSMPSGVFPSSSRHATVTTSPTHSKTSWPARGSSFPGMCSDSGRKC